MADSKTMNLGDAVKRLVTAAPDILAARNKYADAMAEAQDADSAHQAAVKKADALLTQVGALTTRRDTLARQLQQTTEQLLQVTRLYESALNQSKSLHEITLRKATAVEVLRGDLREITEAVEDSRVAVSRLLEMTAAANSKEAILRRKVTSGFQYFYNDQWVPTGKLPAGVAAAYDARNPRPAKRRKTSESAK